MSAPRTLPVESDFDPFGGDLDAQTAWKHFGGLNIEEACERFKKRPGQSAEDFMWMGQAAFSFYFPAIDKYVRTANQTDHMNKIGLAIYFQFRGAETTRIDHLRPQVASLAKLVVETSNELDNHWTELANPPE